MFSREEGPDEVELAIGACDEVGRLAPTDDSWVMRREPWRPAIPSDVRRNDPNRTDPQRTEP